MIEKMKQAVARLVRAWQNEHETACRTILIDEGISSDFIKSVCFFRDDNDEYAVRVYIADSLEYAVTFPLFEELDAGTLYDIVIEAYYSDPGDIVADKYQVEQIK